MNFWEQIQMDVITKAFLSYIAEWLHLLYKHFNWLLHLSQKL